MGITETLTTLATQDTERRQQNGPH